MSGSESEDSPQLIALAGADDGALADVPLDASGALPPPEVLIDERPQRAGGGSGDFDDDDDDDDLASSSDSEVDGALAASAASEADADAVAPPRPAASLRADDEAPADEDEDERPLAIVDEPRKHGDSIMNAYTVYSVRVRDDPVALARRYSDFKALHDALRARHPLRVTPPVPGKSITSRFDQRFIEVRTFELGEFLNRVLAHPVLRDDESTRAFLTPGECALGGGDAHDDDGGAPASDAAAAASSTAAAQKAIANVGSALWSAVSSVSSLPATVAKAAQAPPDEVDPYVDSATARLAALRDAVASVAAAARARARVLADEAGVDERRGGAVELTHALFRLSQAEAAHDAASAARVSEAAAATQHQLRLLAEHSARVTRTLANPADYYARLCDAVGAVLARRLSLLAASNEAHGRLMALQRDADGSAADSDALAAARAKAEAASKAFDDANDVASDELRRFFADNAPAIHKLLRSFAVAQLEYLLPAAQGAKELSLKLMK